MKKKNSRKILITVGVAALLVMSVLTAAMVGVSGEAEAPAVEVNDSDSEEIDDELEFERDEINARLDELRRKFERGEMQKEPHVLPEEMTQMLAGDGAGVASGSDNELMTDPYTKDLHNVNPVHDMGIDGEGVQVSLMDTGFDMAHPDLAGRQAIFEYDEETMDENYSAYDGHPIAYDAVSMADYVVTGDPDYARWYVNTSYEVEAYVNDTGVIVADYGDYNYTMPDHVEAGEMVRFGDHPDEKLAMWYGERPALLLTQNEDEEWANVTVDLQNDKNFANEETSYIGGENTELITKDVTGDGITDISGGMMYFVGDGENAIPYAEHFRDTMNDMINLLLDYPPGFLGENKPYEDAWEYLIEEEGFDLPHEEYTTPGDGEMVALMGDFNPFGSYGAHGTWTASAVGGQGVTGVTEDMMIDPTNDTNPYPPTPEGSEGLVQGLAPNATLIPMGDFFTGATTDIGAFAPTYSSIFFTTEGYTGNVSITSDSADIASSSFGRTVDLEIFGGYEFVERLFDYVGTYHSQGNTLFVNSAGNEGTGFRTTGSPSSGEAILSVGAAGNQHYRTAPWRYDDEGPNPWFGEVANVGSRGPAGRGAQGVDVIANGQFGYGSDPVNQQVANIGAFQGNNSWTLWSGTSLSSPNAAGVAALAFQAYYEAHGERPTAMELKDFVKQGAQDIENSPFNQGSGLLDAEGAVEIAQGEGLLASTSEWRPGENPETGEFTPMHVSGMEANSSYTEEGFELENPTGDEVSYSIEATDLEEVGTNTVDIQVTAMDDNPVLMINEDGIHHLVYNETTENWELNHTADLEVPNADIFRFGVHTPIENLDGQTTLAEFYCWTDVNDNGTYDGIEERNRMGFAWAAYADELTSDYFDVYNPMERIGEVGGDGIMVQMNHFAGPAFDLTLNVRQFNNTEWDWIDVEDHGDGTIAADGTINYDLTANVPEGVGKGIYEGKVMIENEDTGRVNVKPITITVGEAVEVDEHGYFDMTFGANDGTVNETGLYMNDRIYGSNDFESGDWRQFHFTLDNETSSPVAMNIKLANPASHLEAYLLGPPAESDAFSWMDQGRYGTYNLETIGSTDVEEGAIGLITEEALEAGIYSIVIHGQRIAADEPYELFEGQLFTIGDIDDDPTVEHEVSSYEEADDVTTGSFEYQATPGFDADTVTSMIEPPAVTEFETWIDEIKEPSMAFDDPEAVVEYGTHSDPMILEDVTELHLEYYGESEDLILYVWRGEPDPDGEWIAWHPFIGSEGELTLPDPDDGIYTLSMMAYDGAEGDMFGVDITTTIEVEGLEWDVSHPASFEAGENVTFTVDYSLPSVAGVYGTWIGIGRECAPRAFELQPQITLIDNHTGTFELDEEASTTPVMSENDMLVFEHKTAMYTPLDHSATEVTFDGTPVPDESVTIDEFNDIVTINAYEASALMGYDEEVDFEITVSSESEIGLKPEGSEVVTVGTLELDVDPLPDETESSILRVSGQTTPGATVEINGEEVTVSPGGQFSSPIVLEEGSNDIIVEAEDRFERTREFTDTVTLVYPEPAYFEVEITDYDDEVEEGDTVTVEFTVTNTGDEEATQDIVFTVDGVELDRVEDVTLDGGEAYSGEFTWEAEDEGDYTLEVASDDDSDSVTVTVEEEEDEPLLDIPGFTTMLLILGAIIAVAIYHKKEQ